MTLVYVAMMMICIFLVCYCSTVLLLHCLFVLQLYKCDCVWRSFILTFFFLGWENKRTRKKFLRNFVIHLSFEFYFNKTRIVELGQGFHVYSFREQRRTFIVCSLDIPKTRNKTQQEINRFQFLFFVRFEIFEFKTSLFWEL